MKALIYCKSGRIDWITKNFGGESPYLLQIVNKSLLEYYIDFCTLKQVNEVRIVSTDDDGSVSKYFGDGSKWGLKISYGLAKENDTIDNVYLKNKGFCKDAGLLVIDGFGFIDYDKNVDNYPFFESHLSSCVRSSRLNIYYIYREDTETKIDWSAIEEHGNPGFGIIDITRISDYYQLSCDIITHKSDKFVLPGYSSEKNVFIGQNVEIAKSCRVERPVMIGNNVQLKNSASIGINTIIGNNVIIDSDATISGSIIYGNSYVGSGVEIVNKIVYKNFLISPDTGDAIEIVDSFLTSKLGEGALVTAVRSVLHFTVTVGLMIAQLIPAGIVYLLMIATGVRGRIGSYIVSKGLRTIRLADYQDSRNPIAGLFRRLSFDKFPLLIEAFKGNIHISGNTIYQDSPENRDFINSLPSYRPGIFSYTESIGATADEYQCRINDSYYCYNRSIMFDLHIAFKSLFNRLINN